MKLRAGGTLDRFVSGVTQRMFRDAGKQLFLEDREPKEKTSGEDLRRQSVDSKPPDEGDRAPVDAASKSSDNTPPLIAKLAFDVPNEGFFYSALKVHVRLGQELSASWCGPGLAGSYSYWFECLLWLVAEQ